MLPRHPINHLLSIVFRFPYHSQKVSQDPYSVIVIGVVTQLALDSAAFSFLQISIPEQDSSTIHSTIPSHPCGMTSSVEKKQTVLKKASCTWMSQEVSKRLESGF